MSVSVVRHHACKTLGEAPHWDDRTQTLFYVDAYAGDFHQWNSVTGEDKTFHQGGVVTFVIPRRSGGVVISSTRDVCHVNLDDGSSTTLVQVDADYPKNTINDAKCDAAGRLWAGTMGIPDWGAAQPFQMGTGSLYSLDKELKLTRQIRDLNLSNGMAWTGDSRTMFFNDSIPTRIFAFDYDITNGIASNQRVLSTCDFMKDERGVGKPDGMCIDAEDKIWVASFGRGEIRRIDPETSQVMQIIDFPGVKNITSCCFGGPHLDEMYVTSAKTGVSEEDLKAQPNASALFKVTGLGVKGTPGIMFEG